MKGLKGKFMLWILLVLFGALTMLIGCDNGKETVDQVTGNKSVKQFQKSKKKINDAVEKKEKQLNSIDEDNSDEDLDDSFDEDEN